MKKFFIFLTSLFISVFTAGLIVACSSTNVSAKTEKLPVIYKCDISVYSDSGTLIKEYKSSMIPTSTDIMGGFRNGWSVVFKDPTIYAGSCDGGVTGNLNRISFYDSDGNAHCIMNGIILIENIRYSESLETSLQNKILE